MYVECTGKYIGSTGEVQSRHSVSRGRQVVERNSTFEVFLRIEDWRSSLKNHRVLRVVRRRPVRVLNADSWALEALYCYCCDAGIPECCCWVWSLSAFVACPRITGNMSATAPCPGRPSFGCNCIKRLRFWYYIIWDIFHLNFDQTSRLQLVASKFI